MLEQVIQCVPNFSEGKDLEKIEKIIAPLKNREGVKLLSVEPDKDYNRTVVNIIGEPLKVLEAVYETIGIATELIDLNVHRGEHSRMGATDVVPFIPIKNIDMEECIELAITLGKRIADDYKVPVFLYEEAATCKERINLAAVRKGQFEGMAEKMKDPQWKPDFGECMPHRTAGVVGVGARLPLVAFNINLGTTDVNIAKNIAKAIRHSSGGFRYIKAGPAELKEKGIVQVTMNVVNYKKTPLYRVFETVKMEAKRYGVPVLGSEIIGSVPMEALAMSMEYYLGLDGFSMEKILESNL
ncbi:glutamate formimidoyltransferase [Fusobacteria bacterium ZRK30]|nr:glutamate formimidoyltransferase [Fusobacteria bacterium ZRK30]